MKKQLNQNIVLISGGSSGIGRIIVEYLAQQGHKVYAGARDYEKILSLNSIPNVQGVQLDITNQEDIDSAITSIEKNHGFIDVLINNAGIPGWGAIIDRELDYFKRVMNVNVWGMIRLTKACYHLLRKSRKFPIIFNISSQGANYAFPFWAPYHISKYSVRALSDSLRREFLPHNIRVCELQLGPFKSEAFSKQVDSFEEYKLKYVNSEFTPRVSKFFDKIIYNPRRKEKHPIIIAKLIAKVSTQKGYKVRYEPGKRRMVFMLLTRLPAKWVDRFILKMF